MPHHTPLNALAHSQVEERHQRLNLAARFDLLQQMLFVEAGQEGDEIISDVALEEHIRAEQVDAGDHRESRGFRQNFAQDEAMLHFQNVHEPEGVQHHLQSLLVVGDGESVGVER